MSKLGLKGKFGMALASTALGAALIGGGTFALFTSTAANEGNTFTAGTLQIEDVTGGAVISKTMNFNNLAPGDSETTQLTIQNNGSLDAWVRIDREGTNQSKSGDLFAGDHPLQLILDENVVRVPAHGQATLNVGYRFPLEAGNEYQGASGSVTIEVQAVQARNNTNDDGTGPKSWQ